MAKIKTLKILSKKISVTGTGLIKRRRSHRSHLMGKRRNVARKRSKQNVVESRTVSALSKLLKPFNLKK